MKLERRIVSDDSGIRITAVAVDDDTAGALSTGGAKIPPLEYTPDRWTKLTLIVLALTLLVGVGAAWAIWR